MTTDTHTSDAELAIGDRVRVKGTDERVRALYGRAFVGAVGTITAAHRTTNGVARWRVHFPAHKYRSPVRGRVSAIPGAEVVLRADHLARVGEGDDR